MRNVPGPIGAEPPAAAIRARPFCPVSVVANGRSSFWNRVKLSRTRAAEVTDCSAALIDAEPVVDVVDRQLRDEERP